MLALFAVRDIFEDRRDQVAARTANPGEADIVPPVRRRDMLLSAVRFAGLENLVPGFNPGCVGRI